MTVYDLILEEDHDDIHRDISKAEAKSLTQTTRLGNGNLIIALFHTGGGEPGIFPPLSSNFPPQALPTSTKYLYYFPTLRESCISFHLKSMVLYETLYSVLYLCSIIILFTSLCATPMHATMYVRMARCYV